MLGFMKVLSTVALGSVMALGACASTRTASAPSPVWDAEGLTGSMWSEICPEGDPEQTWIALYEDGTFAYLYPNDQWTYDGDETWSLQDGALVIAWNDGYASTRYPLTAGSRLSGQSTKNCPSITLEYVGPAPELVWIDKLEGSEAPEDTLPL